MAIGGGGLVALNLIAIIFCVLTFKKKKLLEYNNKSNRLDDQKTKKDSFELDDFEEREITHDSWSKKSRLVNELNQHQELQRNIQKDIRKNSNSSSGTSDSSDSSGTSDSSDSSGSNNQSNQSGSDDSSNEVRL